MRHARAAACAIAIATTGASFLSHAVAAAQASFMIGVLSSDGILDPLATFDGTRWQTPWPDDGKVPETIAAIPHAWWGGFSDQGWRIALASGERPLRLQRPILGSRDCGTGAAIQTDYVHSSPVKPGLQDWVGIAATGSVDIRAVKRINQYQAPKLQDRDWVTGSQRLVDVLRFMKRPATNLTTWLVVRIPRQDGTDVWEIEAMGPSRFVRVWYSDAKVEHFVFFTDEDVEKDHEGIGSLMPVGAIWGLHQLTVLAWEAGYDGGGFVVLTISAEGVTHEVDAGAFGSPETLSKHSGIRWVRPGASRAWRLAF